MAQQQNALQEIKKGLTGAGAITMFRDVLPNVSGKLAEETAKRFAKMTYTAVVQNPTLQSCTVPSLIKAASISASLDLDIDARGLAYLVPYKNKGMMEAQFQIGYMGLIELAYRSGKVKNISAHCIHESERDKVTIKRIDGQFTVDHPFEWEQPSGDIIAVYATAQIDGLGPVTHVMRIQEVQKYRQRSKSPDSPAWKNDYPAMAKKTCIRQLAKFLPKSILEDFSKGAALDEKESFGRAADDAASSITADMGSEVIDADFEPKGDAQAQQAAAAGTPDWAK